jgi:aspartyl-tRNA(Asn)/glutamyl-tRNA(Gln) amidotransferase subunit A
VTLDFLTIIDAVKMLDEGKITSVELTKHYLDKINKLDRKINALISVTPDLALKEAAKSDDRRAKNNLRSAIDGVPGTLKDVLVTQSVRTTAASKMLNDFIPPYEAHVVSLLKNAGMVVLGKTNLDEYAMGTTTVNSAYFITKNPWDTTRVVGGSSGGSAAAVAADFGVFSLGTDTGGSIRLPASWTNTVGVRPTYGRVSRNGVIAMASSLDQVGLFTRSVVDAALLLSIIAEPDKGDSTSVRKTVPDYQSLLKSDLHGITVGLVKQFMSDGVDENIKKSVLEAVAQLKSLGAEVKEVSIPLSEMSLAVYMILVPSEVSTNLERYDGIRYGYSGANHAKNLKDVYLQSRTHFGDEAKRRIMLGSFALSSGYYDAYYNKAKRVRAMISHQFDQVFQNVDVLVGPVAPSLPFKIGDDLSDPLKLWMADLLAVPVNVAGLCGVSVPCGFSENLPVGLQIMGKAFDDETILAVANAYQKSTNWLDSHPNL